MSLRPLAAQPALFPVVALAATVITLVVLMATWPRPNTAAEPAVGRTIGVVKTPAAGSGAFIGSARIERVLLARERGGADMLVVRTAAGQRTRVVLDVDTRIIVPYDGRDVVAGPDALADGQPVTIELARGSRLVNGAGVATVRVVDASTSEV